MIRMLLGKSAGLVACLFVLAQLGCYVAPANVASRYVKSVPVQKDKGAIISVTKEESPELAGTTLVIEPGALASDETIDVEVGEADIVPGNLHRAGPVAVFGPSGLKFSKPARLTLPYSLSSGDQASSLVVQVSEADGTAWTIPHEQLTVDTSTVAFDVNGFTGFQPGSTSNLQGGCQNNNQCPSGQQCVNGACQCAVDAGPGGAVCNVDSDCSTGEACISGICTNIAGNCLQCASNADCATGQSCVNGACRANSSGGDGGVCVSNADCASGSSCVNGVCQPNAVDGGFFQCTNNAQCPMGQLCDPATGTCQSNTPDAGLSCTTDADCPPNDFCDRNTFTCQSGGAIDAGPAPCFSNADCAMGEVCLNGACVGNTLDGGSADAGTGTVDGGNTTDGGGGFFDAGSADAGPAMCGGVVCAPNESCINGVCQANTPDGGITCMSNANCPMGQSCVAGRCM